MKNFIKVVLVLVPVLFLMGVTDVRGETLQDAVKSVLQNNPDITSVAYNRLGRDQEVRQAMADFFPTIDTSLSTGYVNQDNPFREHFWPRSATVRLNQNIFRGGATLSETMRQKSRVASEAYLLQGTSENTALLACKVYLNYLRALEQSELSKENLLIHQRFYDQIKLRSKAGVDRGVDLDQVTARMALAESNIIVTQANVENARTDYQAVVGHFPVNTIKPVTFDSEIPGTLQAAERIALDNHPTLKSAQADIEARKYQHRTAKALVWPSFDVTAEYTWGNDMNGPISFYSYQDYFQVFGTVRFNIFAGFMNQARIKETSYLINEAEEIAKKTERQTIQSIRLSYDAYMADQRRIKQLEQYVESTGKASEAFTAQWSIGRRTLFDVLDTAAEKITAKSDLINAEYDKMYDSYRILSGMGKLVQTLGLQLPEESRVGKYAAQKENVVTMPVEEPVARKEAVVIPIVQKPVVPQQVVAASKVEEPVAPIQTVVPVAVPVVTESKPANVSSKPIEKKSINEDVQNRLSQWLDSWKSGDIKTYRGYYDEKSFKSKGMNLEDWIAYKTNVLKKSKNVNISMDDLRVSQDKNIATAVFTQEYSSSIFKDKGKKTLKLKKIDDEWKIYEEIM